MKMKKVVITGFCLTSGLIITQAQTKLSFHPEAGEKYEYHTEIVQNIKQSVNGRELPIEETVTMGFLMNVKSKNAQETEAHFAYQNVSYLLNSPMMKMGYDSKKPVENPSPLDKMQEKIFGSVLNKSFSLAVTPDGTVTSVSGVDAITEGIKQAVVSDGQMGAQLSASEISQWLGKDAMKGMFEQTFRIFPANDVKVGDSWTIET
jgi:hypothetical protein